MWEKILECLRVIAIAVLTMALVTGSVGLVAWLIKEVLV